MQITFDHVHLRTPDVEGMAAWFERMLGAEIVRSTQQGKPRVDLKLGGQKIFILPVAAGDEVNAAPVTPCLGLDHIGFFVKDVDKVYADLKAKGAEFTKHVFTQRPGIRVMFLRGPHGISVELLERDEKYV